MRQQKHSVVVSIAALAAAMFGAGGLGAAPVSQSCPSERDQKTAWAWWMPWACWTSWNPSTTTTDWPWTGAPQGDAASAAWSAWMSAPDSCREWVRDCWAWWTPWRSWSLLDPRDAWRVTWAEWKSPTRPGEEWTWWGWRWQCWQELWPSMSKRTVKDAVENKSELNLTQPQNAPGPYQSDHPGNPEPTGELRGLQPAVLGDRDQLPPLERALF